MTEEQEEINQMNEDWVKETFEPHKSLKEYSGNKIEITKAEVYLAIEKIAKNKATSVDGISDSMFKKKTWHDLNWKGENSIQRNEKKH